MRIIKIKYAHENMRQYRKKTKASNRKPIILRYNTTKSAYIYIYHVKLTTLGIKHYSRLLLIEIYHYVGVYRDNKWLTISLHSLTLLQHCYYNRRVQHTAK